MEEEGGPRFSVIRYGPMHMAVDTNLEVARLALEEGRLRDAGDAVVTLATKLWQLYDGHQHMLNRWHKRLIAGCLELLPRVSTEFQKEVFVKLVTFADQFNEPGMTPTLPYRFFLCPVHDLVERGAAFESTSIDPHFALFSRDLRLPSGRVRLSYKAKTLAGALESPSLYWDDGRGYSEDTRLPLAHGPLRDASVEIALPSNVRRLRFDPASAPGVFEIGDFLITPLH
jgi:hypothetical protein